MVGAEGKGRRNKMRVKGKSNSRLRPLLPPHWDPRGSSKEVGSQGIGLD